MNKWARRLVLLGWMGIGLAIFAPACSNPTAPRLPEAEEDQDTVPPEDG
ncbi:MAG TPA: hypothetical protein VK912_10595 [Longimicrobiales bacterium]|jgi:hypothetical protein|nr:hypothetical protein [Longimicrobiales bacterium]